MAELWREELAALVAQHGPQLGLYHRRIRDSVQIIWRDALTGEEGELVRVNRAVVVAQTDEVYTELVKLRKGGMADRKSAQAERRVRVVARSA